MQGQGRGENEKGQGGKNEVVAKTKDKKALAGNERLEREGQQWLSFHSVLLRASARHLNRNEANVLLMWSESHCNYTRTPAVIICLIPCVHLNGPFRTSAPRGCYWNKGSDVISC